MNIVDKVDKCPTSGDIVVFSKEIEKYMRSPSLLRKAGIVRLSNAQQRLDTLYSKKHYTIIDSFKYKGDYLSKKYIRLDEIDGYLFPIELFSNF